MVASRSTSKKRRKEEEMSAELALFRVDLNRSRPLPRASLGKPAFTFELLSKPIQLLVIKTSSSSANLDQQHPRRPSFQLPPLLPPTSSKPSPSPLLPTGDASSTPPTVSSSDQELSKQRGGSPSRGSSLLLKLGCLSRSQRSSTGRRDGLWRAGGSEGAGVFGI